MSQQRHQERFLLAQDNKLIYINASTRRRTFLSVCVFPGYQTHNLTQCSTNTAAETFSPCMSTSTEIDFRLINPALVCTEEPEVCDIISQLKSPHMLSY